MRTRTALYLAGAWGIALAFGLVACNYDRDELCSEIPDSGVILVNSALDEEDGTCVGDCTLREAVVLANVCEGEQTIQLGGETYAMTLSGAGEDLAATGDLDLRDDVVIVGLGTISTFVQGGGDRAFQVMSGVTATIRDVAITESESSGDGGAIHNAGTLTLVDVDIQQCQSDSMGGGIFNTANLTLERTLLYESESEGDGGGIYNEGNLIAHDSSITDGLSRATGGGIYNAETASIDYEGGRIANNHAVVAGGGIYSRGPLASVILEDVTVSRNYSDIAGGVGLEATAATITGVTFDTNYAAQGGGLWIQGPVTVSDSTFTGNGGSEPYSEAIAVQPSDDSRLTMNSSSIDSTAGSGIAAEGGELALEDVTITGSSESGVEAFFSGGTRSATLTGCTIDGNAYAGIVTTNYDLAITNSTITASGLGGIQMMGASIDVSTSTISGNEAPEDGGGMLLANLMGGSIEDSTISGNETDGDGGGLWYWGLGEGVLALRNVTMSGNVSVGAGSGLSAASESGSGLTLTHVTIAENRSMAGGALSVSMDTEMVNSLLAHNIGGNCEAAGSVTSRGHNLDDTRGCGFSGAGDLSGVDAMIGGLADNGGPTQTHALQVGSPAIDTADAAACAPADQRGVARPQGAACDIGAYERESGIAEPPPIIVTVPPPGIPDTHIIVDMNANCRTGPGTVYPPTTALAQGTSFLAQGRNGDASWIQGTPEGERACWLSVITFTPPFDLMLLPLVAIPPTPTPAGDTEDPSVSISHAPGSPTPNTSVAFTAEAEDNEGVIKISIWVKKPGGDWEKVQTCEDSETCSYKGGPYNPGTLSYYAKAWDEAGNEDTSETREVEIK